MILKFAPMHAGKHIRVRVASADAVERTFTTLGTLTMTPEEWNNFRALLVHGGGGDERDSGMITVETTAD